MTNADAAVTADAGLTGRIGRAVLDGLLAPAHPRQRPQSQIPVSRWSKADPHRPACSTPSPPWPSLAVAP
jgi:hypothetical protein